MRVVVVAFAPAEERATVGGFDWFPWTPAGYEAAAKRLAEHVERREGMHSFAFVPVDVPEEVERLGGSDAVTDWLDHRHELYEVGLPPRLSDLPTKETPMPDRSDCVVYGCGGGSVVDAATFALPGGQTVVAGVCADHRDRFARESVRGYSIYADDDLDVTLYPAEPNQAVAGRSVSVSESAADLLRAGIDAFRITREYVGEDLLKEGPGWSWYDWTTRAQAALDAADSPLTPEAREAVDRLLDAPTQTRPSAVARRPDPEAAISDATTVELLTEALERTRTRRWSVSQNLSPDYAPLTLEPDERGAAARELSIVVTLLEDAVTRHNKAVYMERGVFAITDAERLPE